jgi:hypothetical protein
MIIKILILVNKYINKKNYSVILKMRTNEKIYEIYTINKTIK